MVSKLAALLLILLAALLIASTTGAASYVIYFPFRGSYPVTQGYWKSHPGYDWGMPTGTVLYNPFPNRAQVVRTGWDSSGYGYLIILSDNTQQLRSLYGHLRSSGTYPDNVRTGAWVNPGQAVAYSNNTGNSTGPHLHMEIREGPYYYYSSAINFWNYLRALPTLPPQPNPTPTPVPAPIGQSYRVQVIQSCNVFNQPLKNKAHRIGRVLPPQVLTVSDVNGKINWTRYGAGYLRKVCFRKL